MGADRHGAWCCAIESLTEYPQFGDTNQLEYPHGSNRPHLNVEANKVEKAESASAAALAPILVRQVGRPTAAEAGRRQARDMPWVSSGPRCRKRL